MKQLIIVAKGGLANRMRAIASGVSLASHAGADYRVVWPVNSELKCPFEKLFLPSHGFHAPENVSALKTLFLYDDNRKRNLMLARLLQTGRYSLRLTDGMQWPEPGRLAETIGATSGLILIASGLSYYPFADALYRELFRVRPEIEAEASRRLGGDGKSFVGIHIRRTDNRMSIERSPLELFINAMQGEIASQPEVKFYLATDDEATKQTLRGHFGNRIVCSPAKARRDTQEGIVEALVEMTALSLCRGIYGSYWSSFSEASALLGSTPLTILSL